MENNGKRNGMIVTGIGGCFTLLCLVSAVFWSLMVVQDSGAISADEAAPGVGGSCCCMFVSFLIVGAGVAMLVKASKNKPGA